MVRDLGSFFRTLVGDMSGCSFMFAYVCLFPKLYENIRPTDRLTTKTTRRRAGRGRAGTGTGPEAGTLERGADWEGWPGTREWDEV